jgi:ribonuclease BN (tRNA processing enzyme)
VFVDEKAQSIEAAIRGVDVFIADCSYTDAEYPTKKGWGHGTFTSSILSAHRAGAKTLFCTHHEPTRSDDALESAFASALADNSAIATGIDIRLAREGETYEF